MSLSAVLRRLRKGMLLPWLLGAAQVCCAQADGTPAGGPLTVRFSEQVDRDSNLYRLPAELDIAAAGLGPNATREDVIRQTSFDAEGAWSLGQQQVAAVTSLDDNRFAHNSDLDNLSGRATLDWLWQLGSAWSGRAGADYTRALAGFLNTRFLDKDLFSTLGFTGDARYQLGPRWTVRGEVRYAGSSHDNVERQVDDFHSRAEVVGVDYQSNAGNSIGWDYRQTDATFPNTVPVDGVPFDQDYTDRSGHFNLKYALGSKTQLTASAGFLRREYSRGTLGDFSGDVWNATLDWSLTSKLRVTASGWRDLKAYLDAQSDYFVSRGRSIACAWLPTSELTVSVTGSSEDQDYLGTGAAFSSDPRRADRIQALEAKLAYVSMRHFTMELSYRAERRDSTDAVFRYFDRLLHAGVGLKF